MGDHFPEVQLGLRGPRLPLHHDIVPSLPVSLGVYVVSDPGGAILRIGYAGSKSHFGLRSVVGELLTGAAASAGNEPDVVQVEVNAQYWARWRELLIRYQRHHGTLPSANDPSDLEGVFARMPAGGAK